MERKGGLRHGKCSPDPKKSERRPWGKKPLAARGPFFSLSKDAHWCGVEENQEGEKGSCRRAGKEKQGGGKVTFATGGT